MAFRRRRLRKSQSIFLFLLFALLGGVNSIRADEHFAELESLLSDYKALGMPLPPVNARLAIVKSAPEDEGDSYRPSHMVFVCPSADKDRKDRLLIGPWVVDQKPDDQIEFLRLTDPRIIEWNQRDIKRASPGDSPGISVVDFAVPKDRTRGGCLPVNMNLIIAIQFHSLGWNALAEQFFILPRRYYDSSFLRLAKHPKNNRDKLVESAWHYHCTKFAWEKGNRRPIIERLRKLRAEHALQTPGHENIIRDMEATLADRQKPMSAIEAAIEALLDLQIETEWECQSAQQQVNRAEENPNVAKLIESGFDAVPTLIAHLDDFRMTRCVATADHSAYSWNVRIADVCAELLQSYADNSLTYDFLARQGRGIAMDRQHAMNWWDKAKRFGEFETLMGVAFTLNHDQFNHNEYLENGPLKVNSRALSTLRVKFAPRLRTIIERQLVNPNIQFRQKRMEYPSQPIHRSKSKPLLDEDQFWQAAITFAALDNYKDPQFKSQLIKLLDLIPASTNIRCAESSVKGLGFVAAQSNDLEICEALIRAARRSEVGQRMEIVQAMRPYRSSQFGKRFLAAFLDDTSVRDIDAEELPNAANHSGNAIPSLSRKYEGSLAFEQFRRISIQNGAAIVLWGRSGHFDTSWPESEWSKLRSELKKILKDPKHELAFKEPRRGEPFLDEEALGKPPTGKNDREEKSKTYESFVEAIRGGDIDRVKEHAKKDPAIIHRRDMGNESKSDFPLQVAATFGQLEIAKYLLESGVNVNAYSHSEGSTALLCASTPAMADLLLAHGADLNVRDWSGFNALHLAAQNGDLQMVNYFERKGLQLDLMSAISVGKTEELKRLLRVEPWAAKFPFEVLHVSATHKQFEVTRILLENGANPNYSVTFMFGPRGWTPLSIACFEYQPELAKLLCKHGADPNVPASKTSSSVYLSSPKQEEGDLELIELFLKNGLDCDAQWARSSTPMQRAAEENNVPLAKLLFKYGVGIDAEAATKGTPLLIASACGYREMAQFLSANGAKLDIFSGCFLGRMEIVKSMLARDKSLVASKDPWIMRSPLHFAAAAPNAECARVLLDSGANLHELAEDVDARKKRWGKDLPKYWITPLHLAVQSGSPSTVNLLLDRGANPNEPKNAEHTPLEYACQRGNDAIVRALLKAMKPNETGKIEIDFASIRAAIKNIKILEAFVDIGIDVNAALKLAAESRAEPSTKLLLSRGAKPDIETACMLGRADVVRAIVKERPWKLVTHGGTWLSLAIQHRQKAVVEFLITQDIPLTSKDSIPWTMREAIQSGDISIVEMLVRKGVPIERERGNSAVVHLAARNADAHMIRFLMKNGADPKFGEGEEGNSFHAATEAFRAFETDATVRRASEPKILECVKLLLEAGCVVNSLNRRGRTPLYSAIENGHVAVVEHLLQEGARVDIRDDLSRTPLSISKNARENVLKSEMKKITELLQKHGARE